MLRAIVTATVLSVLVINAEAQSQPAPSSLPALNPDSPEYKAALLALRERLRQPAPPITDKERADCVEWMQKANPEIKHTLVGHHIVVMATDGFAARAAKSDFLLNADLGYEVLVHLWGVDPIKRAGRRFFVWPDPGRAGGHNCNGRDLRIAIGRSDWDNAEWFERFFHEMTHGFQFDHPSGYFMINGFFEGWAEFMQAAVSAHLAPLGPPYAGRIEWYSKHFPESARQEYLQTCMPIEEIVQYDPAAGLMMEMINSTRNSGGKPDWAPLRRLLQEPISAPRYVPWHLWTALVARDYMAAFGPEKARPILARFRFPLDKASLDAVAAQVSAAPRPDSSPRAPVRGESGWSCIGPIPNPRLLGFEWNPLDADDMSWRWRTLAPDLKNPPVDQARGFQWREIKPDDRGIFNLDGSDAGPSFSYLAATLPDDLRRPLTLFLSSDDECAVYLDGQIVHFFRGSRECTPDYPDVCYADATDSKGQLVVLVVNHAGRSAFSLAVAAGGLLYKGFEDRFNSADLKEQSAAVSYLASRRWQQPVTRMLDAVTSSPDNPFRTARRWWPDRRPAQGQWVEAEEAYVRASIRGGFFGNNPGSSGNQCLARSWGSDTQNWVSLPVKAPIDAVYRFKIRYACPNEATLRAQIRRGDQILWTSPLQKLKVTGKDWNTWGWHEVQTPKLDRGIYHIELIDPSNGPDIDLLGLVPR